VLAERGELDRVTAVNDIMAKENLLYLLRYDSIRGPLNFSLEPTARGFALDGHEIHYSMQADPAALPWEQHGVQTVVEATGLFTGKTEASAHLQSGAKKVLLTTFSKDIQPAIWGVNHKDNPATTVIAPGDCTLNCVAPIINLLQSQWGIESLHINVIQGYTTRQELIDGPYKGLRRGRAAAQSIIPFEVLIAASLEKLFPDLSGNIETMSTRVPVACGAMAELSVILAKDSDSEEVGAHFRKATENELRGVTALTTDPIVSTDIIDNPHSATIDSLLTRVTQKRHLRLLAWFDNEWGFSNRLADWLRVL
jgi:glyceraldehyde 3-phosphate dehydrogenase